MLGVRFRWMAGVVVLSCVPATQARGDVRVFPVVADTYVSSAAPSRNFGRSATLDVARRPTQRAYLRFNVTLPTDAVISAARLTVFARAKRVAVYRAYSVSDNAWRETTMTFRDAPPLGVRLGAARRGSVRLAASAITQGRMSIALAANGRAPQRLRSREAGRAPRLRVTYTRGGPGKVILAAGDIQRTGTTDNATVSLLESNPFDALLPLGDNQYEMGTLPDYNAFYSQTWGQTMFKARTYPVPGNHEGSTRLFTAYCTYFQTGNNGPAAVDPCPGGRPYYSYNLGTWHMIALDSASGTIDDAQRAWLRADLAGHPSRCTLAYWHHPRYTGGIRGNNQLNNIWDDLMAAGVDVVLSGHTHDYQRFAPMNNDDQVDARHGIREFVVGTGGRSINPATRVVGQEVHNNDTYGVLRMTLRPGGYDWRFLPAPGQASNFTDSGSGVCH